MEKVALKKALLVSMVFSLVLTAIMGVTAILFDLGDAGIRILSTTVVVSFTSLIGLPPALQLERNRYQGLSYFALAANAVTALLLLSAIWFEVRGERYLEWILTGTTVSVAAAFCCMLLMARLTPRYQLAQISAIVLSAALATQVVWSIWTNYEPSWQALSIIALLATTFSLAVPVLHRLSRLEDPAGTSARQVSCPCCSAASPYSSSITCSSCGCKYTIETLGRESSQG